MLCQAYKQAIRKYQGLERQAPALYNTPKQQERIRTFTARLRAEGVDPLDYAYAVVSTWTPWFRARCNRSTVPFGFLLGETALTRYRETAAQPTAAIPDHQDRELADLLDAEYTVAHYWLERCLDAHRQLRMADAVADLRPTLPPAWLALYDGDAPRRHLIVPTLLRLTESLGIRPVNSYCTLLDTVAQLYTREEDAPAPVPQGHGVVLGG